MYRYHRSPAISTVQSSAYQDPPRQGLFRAAGPGNQNYQQPTQAEVEWESDEADDALEEANETQEQASCAWHDANKAREQANNARDEANQSRDDANRAWKNANCARVEANRARDEANRARDEANRIRDEADRARAEAVVNRDNALEEARVAHHLYELAKDEANQALEETNCARDEVIEATQQSHQQYVQLQQQYDTSQAELQKVQKRLDELATEVHKIKDASPPAITVGSTSPPAATLEYELEYQQHRRKRILETVQNQISREHRMAMFSQYSALAKADMFFWETMAEAERTMDAMEFRMTRLPMMSEDQDRESTTDSDMIPTPRSSTPY